MIDDNTAAGLADANARRIAAYWDTDPARHCPGWWTHPQIVRHVNARVCGRPLDGLSRGLTERALQTAKGRVFARGVSVGCGNGYKEMELLDCGLVERFTLFELSPVRLEQGRDLARRKKLEERVEFRCENAFAAGYSSDSIDFVHWNNSLHHMMNVDAAVAWSRHVLRNGGMFYMDDFVGPSRFQWSDRALALCSSVRAALPEKYLANPRHSDGKEPVRMQRPDRSALTREDPSEAADSERILESVNRYFPEAWVERTGGVIYHSAMAHCIQNFDPADLADSALLNLLLVMDDMAQEMPGVECHYAVALAVKDSQAAPPANPDPAPESSSSLWRRMKQRLATPQGE